MPSPSDLIVYPGNFTLEDITMSFATVITAFLVTMGAKVDIGFFRTDITS